MAGEEFVDLFEQLFYSQEVWSYLGIFGMIVLCLIVSYKVKFAFPFSVIILSLMGVTYFDQLTAGGFFAWHIILLFAGSFFCVLLGLLSLREAN